MPPFPDISDRFLAKASNGLVALNTLQFKEIVETGKLKTIDGRGYIPDNPIAVDTELVLREQLFVEAALKQTGSSRILIVAGINNRIKWNLDNARYVQTPFSPTMSAIAQVRDTLREVHPDAEYNYGNLDHRAAVGLILAKRHRK